MADLAVIVQAVDFIEAHLRKPTDVAAMAEAVSYSLYYFCRTFKAGTHHTPYDYLMRRRVAEAARDLLRSDRKIIDIALDYQFNNPETFSRAFRRVLGVSPSEWRERGEAGYRRLMPRLTEAHVVHIRRGAPWRPVIEDWPAFDLVGVMTLEPDAGATTPTATGAAARAAAWAWLRQALDAPNAAWDDCYGLTYYAPTAGAVTAGAIGRIYMVGVKSAPALAQGRALVVKPIPALRYIRFTHRGTARDVGLTLDYIYHTWMPQADVDAQTPPRPALSLYLEHFGATFPGDEYEGREWDILVPIGLLET
jgi:AraC family transcriptional regulator